MRPNQKLKKITPLAANGTATATAKMPVPVNVHLKNRRTRKHDKRASRTGTGAGTAGAANAATTQAQAQPGQGQGQEQEPQPQPQPTPDLMALLTQNPCITAAPATPPTVTYEIEVVSKHPVGAHSPVILALAADDNMKALLVTLLADQMVSLAVITLADAIERGMMRVLNPLYSNETHVLLTFGGTWAQYGVDEPSKGTGLPRRLARKWIHIDPMVFVGMEVRVAAAEVFRRCMSCYIGVVRERAAQRPAISVFTTSFHSYAKILRVKRSLERQTLTDWEWVIMDDSKDDNHFQWLKQHVSADEHRVRLYRRDFHCGNIGNVKNETVLLCRAPLVVEVDHDDELLPYTLEEIKAGFDKFPEVGFVYMNFAECYEDRRPFEYGDKWAFGYGGYRDEVHDGVAYRVALSCDINDVTMSNIVGVPNHPRAWRKQVLLELGNYSEHMPVADDYELLLLTARHTKMLKIDRLGYIQFKNAGGSNFSIIRGKEITKLQAEMSRAYYKQLGMDAFFAEQGVQEGKERRGAHINLVVPSAIAYAAAAPALAPTPTHP